MINHICVIAVRKVTHEIEVFFFYFPSKLSPLLATHFLQQSFKAFKEPVCNSACMVVLMSLTF